MKTAVATKQQETAQEDIAKRAYGIWESKGRPAGHDLDCWLEAEDQVRNQKGHTGKNAGRRTVSR